MWACKNGEVQVVTELLHQYAADVSARMKDDSTAFDWAVLGGHVPTMELLAAHPDVDIRALNKFGCAAVQWAAASGNVNTCRWLYSKGIDFSHINHAGHGAVVKAAWKGHDDALRWLLIDPDGPTLTAQLHTSDLDSLSAAQLARNNGNESTADWLEVLMREDLTKNVVKIECRRVHCTSLQRTRSRTEYIKSRMYYSIYKAYVHPGELATKVRYFGVKSTKVLQEQMGT